MKVIAKRPSLFFSKQSFFMTTAGKAIQKSKLIISKKQKINHDCYIYSMRWDNNSIILDIGEHLKFVQNIPTWQFSQGQTVQRKYTPISPCNQNHQLQFLLKIYRANQNPSFPKGGKMTSYLEKLDVGDKINVEGPLGKFNYKGNGHFILKDLKNNETQYHKNKIFFIAGGSGITPVYQVICEILKMPNENLQMILLFANKTEQDIVLKNQLDSFSKRIQIHYLLDSPPEHWKGLQGRVNKKMLEDICSLDEQKTLYIHCGPGPMNTFLRNLFKENYPKSTLFKF